MKLPHWVQKDIEILPAEFTGKIVIEYWSGGVTRPTRRPAAPRRKQER